MARYTCERCGEESNTLSPPHMCKDIAKRLNRRNKAASIVNETIKKSFPGLLYNDDREALSHAIVSALWAAGLQDEAD